MPSDMQAMEHWQLPWLYCNLLCVCGKVQAVLLGVALIVSASVVQAMVHQQSTGVMALLHSLRC